MSCWQVKGKGWRYQFRHNGKRYSGAWFPTRAAARAAEAEHRKKLQTRMTPTAMAFSALANEYLDFSRRRHARKTYKYKAYVFRSFIAFAGDLPLNQINLFLLEAYLRTRPTNTNYNRHRKDLCALFAWAWRRRLIPENPCFFLEKMPEPQYVRRIPTKEEMAKILLAAGSDRPFLLVLYHTLGRLDEILRLRWEDVNFQERWVRLWTRKRKDGTWEYDLVPMNQVLYDTLWLLWQNRESEEWVFVNPKTGTRYMRRPKLMAGICRRAGVPAYGFHAIRHFVASRLSDEKKFSLDKVSRLLRHRSRQTTERYLHLVDPDLRRVMEALEE